VDYWNTHQRQTSLPKDIMTRKSQLKLSCRSITKFTNNGGPSPSKRNRLD